MSITKMEVAKKATTTPTGNEPKKGQEKSSLAEKMQFFARMNNLSRMRSRFTQTMDLLQAANFNVDQEAQDFDEVKNFKLKLIEGYNTEVLSVSNLDVLKEFKAFMISKIEQKIAAIDSEILKG
jgi:hypothetical protein